MNNTALGLMCNAVVYGICYLISWKLAVFVAVCDISAELFAIRVAVTRDD